MKIGILKETKTPIDNRVALSPAQIKSLQDKYPDAAFVVEPSDIRVFADDEYRECGIEVNSDMSDCDVLFGIKEAKIETLIPSKHYFFFGHIAKKQPYNRPLLQAFMQKGITFSDYEYLVDDKGIRVCAFGWWAGAVGVYYTLRGYGLRTGLYSLPKPTLKFKLTDLIENLRSAPLPSIRILLTGNGRVSHGAQHVLDSIGACRMTEEEYMSDKEPNTISYAVADIPELVTRTDGGEFSFEHFVANPSLYESRFMEWGQHTDVLITCHFWAPGQPVYLTKEGLRDSRLRIKMIGDVTCDIEGSIKSTIRPCTHDDPYYDYNPATGKEEAPFSSASNITVMAVDTCPNALAHDSSEYFGDMLTKHVFEPFLSGNAASSKVINGATITENGKLTKKFSYLEAYARGEE